VRARARECVCVCVYAMADSNSDREFGLTNARPVGHARANHDMCATRGQRVRPHVRSNELLLCGNSCRRAATAALEEVAAGEMQCPH
jgi:hypothetical protein